MLYSVQSLYISFNRNKIQCYYMAFQITGANILSFQHDKPLAVFAVLFQSLSTKGSCNLGNEDEEVTTIRYYYVISSLA